MGGRWVGLGFVLCAACTRSNPWFYTVPEDGSTGGESSVGESSGAAESTGSASSEAASTGPGLPESTSGTDPAGSTTEHGSSSDEPPAMTSEGSTETTSGESTSGESTGGESTSGESTGDASTGESACMGQCDSPGCGVCPDADMVDVDGFMMDATEVTQGQYAGFLAANVAPEMQGLACAWNSDFTPEVWPPIKDDPLLPVVNVDWCDAQAYCTWAKKRLCGKIGGGTVAIADVVNPTKSQWYRACSGGIDNIYPYSGAYKAEACNGMDAGKGGAVQVGSMPQCEGSVLGLFDLSGNVFEWVDSCESTEPGAQCLRRGGSFFSDAVTLQCNLKSVRPRSDRDTYVGFRCCGA